MFVAVKTAGDEFEIADAGKKLHFLRELVRIDEITRPHDFEPRLIIVLLVVSRRGAITGDSTQRHITKAEADITPEAVNFKIRSEEHTSALQSLMSSSYAVFCEKPNTTIESTPGATHISRS